MGSPHILRTTARGSQRRGARGGAAEARAAAAPDLSSRPLVFDAISSRPTQRALWLPVYKTCLKVCYL